MEDVICMSRLIHYHYPKCKILLVSIKPCPARVQSFDKYKKANLLMEKYAVLYDYIDFVSVWNKFVDENDRPIMKYFMDDQIHITPEAYLLFKEVMEDKLLKNELKTKMKVYWFSLLVFY